MYTYQLKKAKAYTFFVCLLLITSCKKSEQYKEKEISVSQKIQELFVTNLQESITNLDSIVSSKSIIKKKKHYVTARKHFKIIEPILAYIDKNNYKSLNAPNILIVKGEESFDTKLSNPFGFQVIEETLYDTNLDSVALYKTVNITSSRLNLIKKNTKISLKNYHLIWMIRDQITRIATTGITGFDSPVLNQSLLESTYTYQTLLTILKYNTTNFTSKKLLEKAILSIQNAQKALLHDFTSFDRYSFIKNHTHQQLKILLEVQKDWQVVFPFKMALSNNLTSLFSKETLNTSYFTDYNSDTLYIKDKIAFGKQLFNDVSLSKNYNMACVSCHKKELAFTDGKRVFNNQQTRNSPTLTYSAYQRGYFMDARTGSLEGQIIGVVNNHNEFNMSMDSIVLRVLKNKKYKNKIDSLYKNKRIDYNIRHAIASYIRTLNTFNSKFDKNIRNEENTLTLEEKNGFNLFTGKALCATCHFAPIFNGTVPPDFIDTELEAIGTPENKDTINPKLSADLGRYEVYKTPARKHFFKTPTVRNIAKTAPYMHNGVYNTLEEVVDFYNKGGGVGLGLNLPNQTLPFDNLNLSKEEISSIIAFLKTLTDNDY